MSIHHKNACRDLLNEALRLSGKPMPVLSIAEYGNQKIKTYDTPSMRRMQSAKSILQFFGVRHVSFDTNGRDDCVVQDLGVPINDRTLLGTFDMVTNFGTSEHVRNGQYWAFRNAHELIRPGGLMVHAVPRTGTCRRHGAWHYTADWFSWLADAQGYERLKLIEWDKSESWPDKEPGSEIYVLAILRRRLKGGRRFMRMRRWRQPDREPRGR